MTDQPTQAQADIEALQMIRNQFTNAHPPDHLSVVSAAAFALGALDRGMVALQRQEEMAAEIELLRGIPDSQDTLRLLKEIERLKAELAQATQKERERCVDILKEITEEWGSGYQMFNEFWTRIVKEKKL